jgi:hypothetical protein
MRVRPRLSQEITKNDMAKLYPSEFTSRMMYLPNDDGDLIPFSFKGREYLLPVYDTSARRVLLKFARQSEKSTYLGNLLLIYSILRRHFRSLLVTPTQSQTETFSRDKINKPIESSAKIRTFIPGVQSVFRKVFITGSEIDLRYAFLHADRTRGIPKVDLLCLDELQDILTDIIPVIEETQKHSTFRYKRYSGTPKSVDNTIAKYWQAYSTQYEWVIPCDFHTPRHWIVVRLENVGKKHLICERCGNQIYPAHPEARWASMRTKSWLDNPPTPLPFEGYRIPQVITPWVSWDEVIDTMHRYTTAQFYNEVLGMEYDSSEKLLTTDTLQECSGGYTFEQGAILAKRATHLWMGIDWGSDGDSKTVVTIGGYFGGKFSFVYMKRFVGEESTQVNMMPIIKKLIHDYKIKLVGVDYGGGLDRNDELIRDFGIRKIIRYQYVNTKRVYFDKNLMRWMVNRSEVLMALINAINRKDEIEFPKWECWEHPFAQDLLSVFKEYNNARRVTVVDRTPGTTDDTLHSMLYCFLVSMMMHPRPDILTPDIDDR